MERATNTTTSYTHSSNGITDLEDAEARKGGTKSDFASEQTIKCPNLWEKTKYKCYDTLHTTLAAVVIVSQESSLHKTNFINCQSYREMLQLRAVDPHLTYIFYGMHKILSDMPFSKMSQIRFELQVM